MQANPAVSVRFSAARPRRSALIAFTLLGTVGAGVAAVPAGAAAPGPKRPTIVSFAALQKRLTSNGGAVRLTVRVAHAATCTFRGQSAAFASLNRVKTVSCAGGRATVVLTVEPNFRTVPATIHYHVRVTAKGRSVQKALTVVEAAAPAASTVTPPPAQAPPPAVVATALPRAALGTAYTATLSASDGSPPYTWTVSAGALPPGLSLSLAGTIAGTPTAAGTFAFTVEVADSALQTASADLSIVVAAPGLPVEDLATSLNWSGYALDAGPFTSVTGTFDVPGLTNLSDSVNTSEWIGVDGDSPTNTDLIQAGVAEDYSQFGGVSVYAWWEILPAAETRISLAVKPGDTMTVTIARVSDGQWSIRLVNDTTGETFSTTQAYAGQALSTEWIVEAPTDPRDRVTTLGEYSPPVTFTHIGWAGTATAFSPIEMKQDGSVVSSPSPLSADQSSFSVAYGATAPPAPG